MSDYEERLRNEIQRYAALLRGRMFQQTPMIWQKAEERFADTLKAAIGVRNLYEYVARHVRGKDSVEVLGLGSGACGPELDGIAPLLNEQSCQMNLVCADINPDIIEQAKSEASKRGIKFRGILQDANRIVLESNRYDVIVAYAALHHFVELDHIAREINRALRHDGIFVTVDIPTRNGYRMWDETAEIVGAIWKILPDRFKVSHTWYREPTYVATYENKDFSGASFECVNSEAILPALRAHLREMHFVPVFSIARRFFDTSFGPNFDWNQPIDRAIFEFIMQLDAYYLQAGLLRPETFFGAYAKRI